MLYFVIDTNKKELGRFNSSLQASLFVLDCWEKGFHDIDIIQATSRKQFKKIIRKENLKAIDIKKEVNKNV